MWLNETEYNFHDFSLHSIPLTDLLQLYLPGNALPRYLRQKDFHYEFSSLNKMNAVKESQNRTQLPQGTHGNGRETAISVVELPKPPS